MGGGCTCNSSIKKYCLSSVDYVINPESITNNHSRDNTRKTPENNIKIISKEDKDNINCNIIQNSNKTNEQIISNNNESHVKFKKRISNIENKGKDSNNNADNNSSICSDISNKKINDNKKSDTVIINKIDINQNNFGPKHKAVQKKLVEKERGRKTEANFNYNLGEHNVIFININNNNSISKNDSEKDGSATPKMDIGKDNWDDMAKGAERKFSHFYVNKMQQNSKYQSKRNNQIPIKPDTIIYMKNYSEEMLNSLNWLRKNPESFIKYIDSMVNDNIERKNDDIYLISEMIDEKIKIMEDYLLIFDQIKKILKDIIDSKKFLQLEEFKYNEELEIDLESARFMNINQSHMEMPSISNEKYLSNINNSNYMKKKKKNINLNSILDLDDDKIANLILEKRRELKVKYPANIFKLNIIKDININILMQISMEFNNDEYNNKNMLNDIIFNPRYKNFAVSWANELNRNFLSISCYA